MEPLLILALSSFVFSLALTPLLRNLLRHCGVMDKPDATRKLHAEPVPRAGGLPILLSCAAAYALLAALPGPAGVFAHDHVALILTILPPALVAFSTGLLDDLFGIRPWQKLAGLAAAASLAYALGIRIESVAGYSAASWWSLPLTVLWLVACSNAYNLIDGLDGLAAGLGLFACLTMLLAAFVQSNVDMTVATLPLAGALAGFLRYNYRPASIFLGDSGSLLIGFVLGCFGIAWSQKSATVLAMMAPPMAMAIPLADAGLAVVRRLIRRQPVFAGDRGHIHHRLLDRGLSPRAAVLLLYAACGVTAVLSLAQSLGRGESGGVVLCLFAGAAFWAIRYLDYRELAALSRMLRARAFAQRLEEDLWLDNLRGSLSRAQSGNEFWAAIAVVAERLDCAAVILEAGSRRYATAPAPPSSAWELHSKVAKGASIRLYGRSLDALSSGAAARFVALIAECADTASLTCPAAEPPALAGLQALDSMLRQQEGAAVKPPPVAPTEAAS